MGCSSLCTRGCFFVLRKVAVFIAGHRHRGVFRLCHTSQTVTRHSAARRGGGPAARGRAARAAPACIANGSAVAACRARNAATLVYLKGAVHRKCPVRAISIIFFPYLGVTAARARHAGRLPAVRPGTGGCAAEHPVLPRAGHAAGTDTPFGRFARRGAPCRPARAPRGASGPARCAGQPSFHTG